jgi:hypothetical protein
MKREHTYRVRGRVFIYSAEVASWWFLPLSGAVSKKIKVQNAVNARAWGSVPVVARIGTTSWQTSLFPTKGVYLLPLKAKVRSQEHIQKDTIVTADLTIISKV